MIRDVGENPLSPALRDIERERGATTAQDTRWLRHLCVVCWCRGEALKVKKLPLRLSSRNECYPSPIFKTKFKEEGDLPPFTSPLFAVLERETLSLSRRTYKKFAFKIVESKSKLPNPFSFLLKIYSALQNSQITVYFFVGGKLFRNKTRAGKCHHVEIIRGGFNQSAAATSLGFE